MMIVLGGGRDGGIDEATTLHQLLGVDKTMIDELDASR
jgi:hypothetical protein